MKKPMIREEIHRISADPSQGLSSLQVEERVSKGYSNKVTDTGEKSSASIIFHNLFTFFNTILFSIALVFLICIIVLNAIGRKDIADEYFGISKFVFLVPAVMNVIMGTSQELHSLKIIKSLKIITKAKSFVVRDSELQTINADSVVIDDIVVLKTGEQASADLIVVSGDVSVDESMLTGESDYVRKLPGDTILAGSTVMLGEAKASAERVGDDTYAAKLSRKVKGSARHKSELMQTILKIVKFLTVMLALVFVTVILTMIFKISKHGNDPSLWGGMTLSLSEPVAWAQIMLVAGTFGAGIIPTGLVLTTSVTLLVSIVSLSRKETLIQEMYSLENLSRVDVICLDKTGTLTDGSMEVSDVKGFALYDDVVNSVRDILASTENKNATAMALYKKFGQSEQVELQEIIPFSSENKYSGIVYADGAKLLIGAPEYLLEPSDPRLAYVEKKAAEGHRVIAMTKDGRLIAFFSLEDHIRDSAKDTLAFFKNNGVSTKIISGDNPLTVSNIAKACGVENADRFISLDGVPVEQIYEIADEYTVFARVSPEQKEALVDALQKKGHKVAMTGDGVNDILALRRANASITFSTATEAAKSCSDVVLLDNDFSHLKEVVAEGRRVIGNVQKTAILFLMKSLAIIVCAFAMIPFARGQMWFTIENAYMLEAAIIGTGGFLLSLEYQKEPIRGSFIKNIALKALAAGLLAATAIILPITMYAAPNYLGRTPFIASTSVGAMVTILLSISGFVVVLCMCLPFNKYRIFTILAVLFVGGFLGLALPTSFLCGAPTGASMFAYDSSLGQTIFDAQFFHEVFQPWNSPVVRNVFLNYDNYLIIRVFLYVAIPVFFIIMHGIDQSLRREYGIINNEQSRVTFGKTMLLVSGVVLIIQRIFAIIADIMDMRNFDLFSISTATVNVILSFLVSGLVIFQGYCGYRVWKTGDRRFMNLSFIFSIFTLVLLVVDLSLEPITITLVFGDNPQNTLATADNLISIIIQVLYILGSFIVWYSRDKISARNLRLPKIK